MSEQANRHSVRVKIGTAEFEASGAESVVVEQYRLFLDALSRSPAPQTQGNGVAKPPGGDGGNPQSEVSDELIRRVFAVNGESVSLRVLPTGDNSRADTILLLMWGYLKIKGLDAVGATTLADSARISGLNIDRVDRVAAPQGRYYQVGGAGKGTRYSLNNPGTSYCEKLLNTMFG